MDNQLIDFINNVSLNFEIVFPILLYFTGIFMYLYLEAIIKKIKHSIQNYSSVKVEINRIILISFVISIVIGYKVAVRQLDNSNLCNSQIPLCFTPDVLWFAAVYTFFLVTNICFLQLFLVNFMNKQNKLIVLNLWYETGFHLKQYFWISNLILLPVVYVIFLLGSQSFVRIKNNELQFKNVFSTKTQIYPLSNISEVCVKIVEYRGKVQNLIIWKDEEGDIIIDQRFGNPTSLYINGIRGSTDNREDFQQAIIKLNEILSPFNKKVIHCSN